jgi:hypothetical protein
MKTCKKCSKIFELSNFYYIEKRNYTDNYCKDCRKSDWKIKRQIREQNLISQGYNSIHDYRIKKNPNYKKYCVIRSRKYDKQYDSKRKKKGIDLASDYYIKQLIKKDKSMRSMQISNELIELYKNNLLLKREIKKLF